METEPKLNIFESKQSLCEFVKMLCHNPVMVQTMLNTNVEDPEVIEFVALFIRNKKVKEFLRQAKSNPVMFAALAEELSEEHPIIVEIFESKAPNMLDGEGKLTDNYVSFCIAGAQKSIEYYISNKADIDTLMSTAQLPFNIAIEAYQQFDENLDKCFLALQRSNS